MAQYIIVQDSNNRDQLRIINSPQQVPLAQNQPATGNVYMYQTTATPGTPSNTVPAGTFQTTTQARVQPQPQWSQPNITYTNPHGQVIYTAPAQQQTPVIVQGPVQRPTLQITPGVGGQGPSFVKMIPAPSVARPQLMPVILNPGYRPRQAAPTQSVIIRNGPQQVATNQQAQPVLIDPRTFNMIQTSASGNSQRPMQFKIVTKQPIQQVAGTSSSSQPVRAQPLLINRAPAATRVARPAIRALRPAQNTRIPRPQVVVRPRPVNTRPPPATQSRPPMKMAIAAGGIGPRPNFVRQLVPVAQRPPPPPVPVSVPARPGVPGEDFEENISTAVVHRLQPANSTTTEIARDMHTDIINTPSSCESAKMLVILPDEEQRLVTFTLPTESCTVTELLEQVGIQLTPQMHVRCVAIADNNLDYVVTITEVKPPPPPPPPPTTTNVIVHRVALPVKAPVTPDAPPHVPKYVEGQLAICDFCGYFSSDHAKCERCHRLLNAPQTKSMAAVTTQARTVVTTAASPTGTMIVRRSFPGPSPKVATPGLATNVRKTPLVIRTTAARGKVTVVASRATKASRIRKVEEPVVLTLSSDEEEDGDKDKSDTSRLKPFPFEPVYAPPEGGDSARPDDPEVADVERVDVCSQMGQAGSEHTAIECKELRFGSYNVHQPNRHTVVITHLGVKFLVQSCADPTKTVKLDIQQREIMKLVVHYAKTLPVIFLYTTPSCGRYIRRTLGMGNVIPPQKSPETAPLPFFDPSNCNEQVKRIVIVARSIREDTKTTVKSIFPRQIYDEISHRDAVDLLQRSRGSSEGERAEAAATGGTAGTTGSRGGVRKSAANASSLIKQVAAMENETGGGGGSSQGQIHKLLIYPQGKGGISINTEDYQCLAVDQYLNDVIIDFYLKYLHEEVMTPEQRAKTHIFSSFFYKRLTATSARQRHLERELKMTAAQKRHNRVKSWTKNVNLFEKEFIVIPINELSHWFLAVICFPGLDKPRSMVTGKVKATAGVSQLTHKAVREHGQGQGRKSTGLLSLTIGNTTITPVGAKNREENIYVNEETLSERDEAEGEDSDVPTDDEEGEDDNEEEKEKATESQMEPIKQPCILLFDSLRGSYRSRVTATLREYLSCEYAAKQPESEKKVFDKNLMPGHNAKVPQQNNFTDCGLFVLQYVEEMSRSPIKDFKLPMRLAEWFEVEKVTRKREDIALLIRNMLEKEHPDRVSLLPEIEFPTLNGEPVATKEEEESSQEQKTISGVVQQQQQGSGQSGEESEDLFDEIENTVVDEAEMTEDEDDEAATPTEESEKKVTKLLIPNKRKSTTTATSTTRSSQDGGSARKTPRIV